MVAPADSRIAITPSSAACAWSARDAGATSKRVPLATVLPFSMPAAARKLRVEFYPGRYHPDYGSIFSMGPYVEAIETAAKDGGKEGGSGICILEEPEHLSFPPLGV